MARHRFVNTNPSTRETQKIELSDGDFVLFKKQLTNKEKRHVNMAAFGSMKGDFRPGTAQELQIDWEGWEPERIFTWLHGWSFVDAAGNPVQFNRANFDNLDDETYAEIDAKLDEFLGEKEKEKNGSSPALQSRLKKVGAGSTENVSQS